MITHTCTLCGKPGSQANMKPSGGGRWLCADVATCCLRFLASPPPARVILPPGRHRIGPAA